ncbi:MAG: prepilin-type N-terminal cleavage/methylation domain-containing protein [Candidatus Omnitrophota bacterium]
MKKRGFTLIELVMVIVIIGILAAIAIPKFVSLVNQANMATTQYGLGAVRSAVMINYAKSATAGTAVFPSDVPATFFADAKLPKNALNSQTAVAVIADDPGSKPTSADAGWWYVSSIGKVGAYSDGSMETSDW